jgi:hypothetical protein
MQPDRVIGDGGCAGRQAKLECAGHCWAERVIANPHIDFPAGNCESARRLRFTDFARWRRSRGVTIP